MYKKVLMPGNEPIIIHNEDIAVRFGNKGHMPYSVFLETEREATAFVDGFVWASMRFGAKVCEPTDEETLGTVADKITVDEVKEIFAENAENKCGYYYAVTDEGKFLVVDARGDGESFGETFDDVENAINWFYCQPCRTTEGFVLFA